MPTATSAHIGTTATQRRVRAMAGLSSALLRPLRPIRAARITGLDAQADRARGVVLERRDGRLELTRFFECRIDDLAQAGDLGQVVAALPLRDAPVLFVDDERPPLETIEAAVRTARTTGANTHLVTVTEGRVLGVLADRAKSTAVSEVLDGSCAAYRITSEVFAIEALARAAATNWPCIALHVGAKASVILLLGGKDVLYAREIATGDDDLIESLTRPFTTASGQRVSLSIDEARSVRREFVYGSDALLATSTHVTFASSVLFALMRPLLERLLLETRKSIKRFGETGGAPMSVVLSGEGAEIHGLHRYFAQELGVECAVANPFAQLHFAMPANEQVAFAASRHRFQLALGLALDARARIDLTLPAVRWRTALRFGVAAARTVAGLFLMLLVLTARQRDRDRAELVQRRAALRRVAEQMQPLIARAVDGQATRGALQQQRQLWAEHAFPSLLPGLVATMNALPPAVSLDKVHAVAQKRIEIAGHIQAAVGRELDAVTYELPRALEAASGLARQSYRLMPEPDARIAFAAVLGEVEPRGADPGAPR